MSLAKRKITRSKKSFFSKCFKVLIWFMVCESTLMSYRSSSCLVPLCWFLRKLRPLDLENFVKISVFRTFFPNALRYWSDLCCMWVDVIEELLFYFTEYLLIFITFPPWNDIGCRNGVKGQQSINQPWWVTDQIRVLFRSVDFCGSYGPWT